MMKTKKIKMTGVQVQELAETMHRATLVRCGCGSYGSWDHAIRGTSGGDPCVWAGCPNCSGTALGCPVTADEFAYARSHASEMESRRREAVAIVEVGRRLPSRLVAGSASAGYREEFTVSITDNHGRDVGSAMVMFDSADVGADVKSVRMPSWA